MACTLVLPDSQRVGSRSAPITLQFNDWRSMAHLSAGLIGRLAQDYVQSRVQIEGGLRDLMALASHLVQGNPAQGNRSHPRLVLRPRASALLQTSAGQRAEEILRAYRLYLAGSAMCFEQGWISLHQMLATQAASPRYPFNRAYMYAKEGH